MLIERMPLELLVDLLDGIYACGMITTVARVSRPLIPVGSQLLPVVELRHHDVCQSCRKRHVCNPSRGIEVSEADIPCAAASMTSC